MSNVIAFKALAIVALASAALLVCSVGHAFVYTVGRSGTGQNCSFPTVQQAIDAAEGTNADDEIWITRDVAGGYYQNQALRIEGLRGTLKIVGGFDNCWDVTPDGMTELHGNGGPRAPVLDVRGGTVTLVNLRFTRGDNDASATAVGGGIAFVGTGVLDLQDSSVDRNEAGRGAGLAVTASGGTAHVRMRRTEVSDNRAQTYGGGILLDSRAAAASLEFGSAIRINRNHAPLGGGGIALNGGNLGAHADGLQMELNSTLGNGGAILAISPANLSIGASPLAGTVGTFVANEARNGGAIALASVENFGFSLGNAHVRLFSTIYNTPPIFVGNRARERGGALFIDRPSAEPPLGGATDVCSSNVVFAGNDAALGGSAVMLRGGSASYRNGAGCVSDEALCTTFMCNVFSGNTSTLDNGQPSPQGSVFEVENAATFTSTGARIASNTTPWLFSTANAPLADSPTIDVDTALIYANSGRSIVSQCAQCVFDMVASTVVANAFTGPVFTNGPHFFHLQETIIDQPGLPLFAANPSSGTSTLAHLVYTSNYASTIASVRQGSPGFMNVAAMDYRLSSESQAIDNLPPKSGVDFIGRPRNVDIPWRPDGLGNRDIGAVETQLSEASDVILRSGFD